LLIPAHRFPANRKISMPSQMTDEMDSSYSNAPVTPPDKSPAESVDETNEKQGDVLIEKSKLGDKVKPGDTCTFRVTADYGSEVALEYVKEGQEEHSDEMHENPEETTDRELTALDQGNQ
jgi:hypothetical protein